MKKILIVLLSLMLITSLTFIGVGCKEEAKKTEEAVEEKVEEIEETAEETSGEVEEEEPITITFWMEHGWTEEYINNIVEVVNKPFIEAHPNVTFDMSPQANVFEATKTALAAGGGPDIVLSFGLGYAKELAKAGYILPLEEYIEKYNIDFLPWVMELKVYDDKMYAFPDEIETMILFYNKTLFEDKGWEVPKTFDELITLCEEIDEEGIIPFGHCNSTWRYANEWWVGAFMNHIAGPQKVYEALKGEQKWTDPDFLNAIEVLNMMQSKDWFMGGLDRYYTGTFPDAFAAMGNGDIAMQMDLTGKFKMINNFFGEEAGNSNEWSWATIPTATGEELFCTGIGNFFSINANSKDPELVAEYLSYYYAPEAQIKLFELNKKSPAQINLEGYEFTGVDERFSEVLNAYGDATSKGNYGYLPWVFWPPKTETYLAEEIEKVWAGELTSQQYLDELQEIFDEEFAEDMVPPIPKR